MPLNIDWQQILLHWMNLAILTGGLYFILYKPVKKFMDQREERYRQADRQAADKLAEAEKLRAEYQAKLDGVDEEIRQARVKAHQEIQQSTEEQMAQAKEQAGQIIAQARVEAEQGRQRMLSQSRRELRQLAVKAARKLAFRDDPFDQFLDLAEEGEDD